MGLLEIGRFFGVSSSRDFSQKKPTLRNANANQKSRETHKTGKSKISNSEAETEARMPSTKPMPKEAATFVLVFAAIPNFLSAKKIF